MVTPKIKSIFDKYNSFLVLVSAFTISTLLFHPSLDYYFFQDDWFVLNWVKHESIWSFFKFRDDIIYWRPLSMPTFFFIGHKIFGLNPIPFHVFSFTCLFLLVFTVYLLFKKLFNNKRSGLMAAFLYAVWPIHFMSLSWLSTTSYIFALSAQNAIQVLYDDTTLKSVYLDSFEQINLAGEKYYEIKPR